MSTIPDREICTLELHALFADFGQRSQAAASVIAWNWGRYVSLQVLCSCFQAIQQKRRRLVSRSDFLETAKRALQQYYPDCACAFVAGSLLRGEGTAKSDIDIVVIFDDDFEDIHRFSVIQNAWPIEFFVHNVRANSYYMGKDRDRGMCVMMDMVANGIAVPAETDLVRERRALAQHLIEEGPPPLSGREIKARLYRLASLLDDLDETRPQFENMAVLATLLDAIGDFFLRVQGQWSGFGKPLARILKRSDENFALQLEHAFTDAHAGRFDDLRALTEELIDRFGGRPFDGYFDRACNSWSTKALIDPDKWQPTDKDQNATGKSLSPPMSFHLIRQCDDLVYSFDRKEKSNGRFGFKRRDQDLWITHHSSLGWVAYDEQSGSVFGRPWDVPPSEQSVHAPPEGLWVSRKASKSYVYDLKYSKTED